MAFKHIKNTESKEKLLKELTRDEYKALFTVLRDATVKGSNLESTYHAIAKLQNQYLEKYGDE